jgi:hypothetical protein
MRRLIELICWLGVIGLQISLWPQLTDRFRPAFTLAAALAWGLASGRSVSGPDRARVESTSELFGGFVLAALSGLALDFYAQHSFGLLATASALGYAVIWLVIRPPVDEISWPVKVGGAALGAGLYELTVLAVTDLTTQNFPFLAELTTVATLNVAGTTAAFIVFAALIGAYRRRFG